MNENRQYMISTNKEQSMRLQKCRVSAYTADMTLSYCKSGCYELMAIPFHYGCYSMEDTPAWSLNALLGLLPKEIDIDGYLYRISIHFEDPDEPVIGNQWCVFYKPKRHDEKGSIDYVPMYAKDLIECAVLMIEWLSANGHKLNVGE